MWTRPVIAVALPVALLTACAADDGSRDGSAQGSVSSGTGGGSSSATPTTTSTTSTTGADAPASCAPFPTGPVGVNVGDVLDPTVSVHGFIEGSAAESTILLGDLRDCDGSAGVDAVLLIASRTSCSTCREEAETLAAEADVWAASGVRTVVLLLSGDLDAWRETYGLERIAVLADPQRTLDLPEPPPEPTGGFQMTSNGTPLYVVVDPRTGRIHERHLGADWDDAELLALAARNAEGR